ncbi:dihydrofolate reductase [Spirosoma taeanense]|uniref:Dihydrofolate reductase n=1 Tax=Spirosoma taeanense TaxID=2735870 RepID=A0A6M5YDY8_9BACT|nr:dihydrofolate reductase family protein [Spirosoma taeanense]QJW91513.1 dihydrofolate reductase [Spirosoma taeanense]
MRKLILYIASSLDGFIARSDGSFDWLDATPNPNQLDYGYHSFYVSIDTTLMGNSTYQTILDMGGDFPYPDKTNYVFSRQPGQVDTAYVRYITDDPAAFVQSLKNQEGKAIWLVGGGQLNAALLNARLIDEIILTLVPTVLGSGIPLFADSSLETQFSLTNSESFETGFVQLTYAPALNSF